MIRVGVVGTSEWTERMYIRGLANHPDGKVVAVCARDVARTRDFAQRNGIDDYFTDYRDLMDNGDIDAVILSTPNHTHYPMMMHALKRGLHVMCEKPVALNYAQADAMASEAERRGVVHLTAFTYNYFPYYRYAARLVREGYVGTPYHLNLRYYSAYGVDGTPLWRFRRSQGGEGALFDIGSHALALCRDLLGEVVSVAAQLNTHVLREGIPAKERAADAAILTLQFASGAVGSVHISMASAQPTVGGPKQAFDISGSGGVLRYVNDFATSQVLMGAQAGDKAESEIRVPDEHWPDGVSRANPREAYTDLYTVGNTMARDFVSAIADGSEIDGLTLRDGAVIQRLLDAAVESHAQNNRAIQVPIP